MESGGILEELVSLKSVSEKDLAGQLIERWKEEGGIC